MTTGRIRIALGFALVVGAMVTNASAQQRPLVTEDPETVGSGVVLVEAGLDYLVEEEFPATGLTGDLLQFPTFGVSLGISSIAEIQIDGVLRNSLSITDRQNAPLSGQLSGLGDSTAGGGDIIVGTKVRLKQESSGAPALGVRFATKLPTASNESGLGLDTLDFLASLLVGKTIRSVRVVGNFGFAILGDPIEGDEQNSTVTYGVSFARAIREGLEVVGELNGRVDTHEGDPSPGTESRSALRLGARYTRGAGRFDGGVIIGVTTVGPTVGFTAGYTHAFNAFTIP